MDAGARSWRAYLREASASNALAPERATTKIKKMEGRVWSVAERWGMGGKQNEDAPQTTPLTLLREALDHAVAELEALDGRAELDNLGDLLTRIPFRFHDETPASRRSARG